MIMHNYTTTPEDAEAEYINALQECARSGLDPYSPETTGILLRLADLYEKLQKPDSALQVYGSVLIPYGNVGAGVSGEPFLDKQTEQRLRKAVGIAQRIGDIYKARGQLGEAERFYEWSVKTMLGLYVRPPVVSAGTGQATMLWTAMGSSHLHSHIMTDEQAHASLEQHLNSNERDDRHVPDEHELDAPSANLRYETWATAQDLGASLESLATLYALQHRNDLALTLFFRALQLLKEDADTVASHRTLWSRLKSMMARTRPDDDPAVYQCRSAILHNNIAESYVELGKKYLPLAERYASGAFQLAEEVDRQPGSPICKECAVTARCNMGTIAEMRGDLKKAFSHFLACRNEAANMQWTDGVRVAREGMQRVRSTG
ncbi:hypothetical protein HDU85_001818 [Gaertneriomyces sp. JEL0708]|nr:hypothetical protein HDU85_001818 [Gaertneriomyces sp. JEL0708]